MCRFKASGRVYQWGTGLSSHAKRTLNSQPVPAHLTSKEPCLVPGTTETHMLTLNCSSTVNTKLYSAGLDHVTPRMVIAGSTHCICLTGDTS